jgi:acyl carrier protein
VIDLVFQKVANILAEIIDIDYEDITPETELISENGIKAVDVAKLVIECEKKFKITIHDEDVHNFRRVNDVVEYINRIKSDL